MKWLHPVKKALISFNKNDGWAMASHVSLSLMISVFPFLIFCVSLASILGADGISSTIVKLAFDSWPDVIAEPLVNEIRSVVSSSNAGVLSYGLILAMFFASNGIEAIRDALNRAYGDSDKRSFWKLRLQSLQFVLVGAMLMLLMSILLVFAPIYFSFTTSESPATYNWFYRSDTPGLFAALGLLIFFVYASHRWLSDRTRQISAIWPGIILTLAVWIISTVGFTFYVESFATYSSTYAGLAGITIAMMYLYLISAILIFGAEYNSALQKEKVNQTLTAEK